MIKSVKRLGAAVLSAVMMLTAVATPLCDNLPIVSESVADVASAETYTYGDYDYSVRDDQTVCIRSYTGKDKVVNIPEEIDGKKVSTITEYAFSNDTIEIVNIPSTVTILYWMSFAKCNNLREINIPESVSDIKSVPVVQCPSIEKINVSEKNSYFRSVEGVLFSKDMSQLIYYPSNKKGDTYKIPDEVKEFSEDVNCGVFNYNQNLKSITINASVNLFTDYFVPLSQFDYASKLEAIYVDSKNPYLTSDNGILYSKDKTILVSYPANYSQTKYVMPDNVCEMSFNAFYGAKNLKEIQLSEKLGVSTYSVQYFLGCEKLESINVPESNNDFYTVDGVLFRKRDFDGLDNPSLISYPQNKKDSKYEVPTTVKSIEVSAFEGNANLSTIIVSDNVEEINGSAFMDCTSLSKVVLPSNLKKIESWAFRNCTSLTNINIPASVTKVGVSAFLNCSSLNNVTIPFNVTEIMIYAFGYRSESPDFNVYQKKDNFKIYCYSGTAGEQYAKENGFDYELITAEKPAKVTGFKVKSISSTNVTLQWNKNANASGYEIEQYKSGKWVNVAKITGNATTSYTVKGLAAGTAGYKFRMRAVRDGAYSDYTSVLTVNTNPYGVGGFKCSSKTSTSVTLKWNKGTTASGYQLQQYKDGKWVTIYTGTKATNTSYTVKGLKAGTAGYRFRIRAYKTYGNTKQYGSWSSEVKVNTNPYGVGGFKCSSKTSTSVTLKWNKGTTASGYQLQQYKDGKWVTIYTSTKATNTSYTVKNLKAGTAGYRFRIRAYKTYGNTKQYGSWSSEVKVNTNPYGVGGFKCSSKSSTSVTLKWNKGTTASGYQLQQYKGGKWVTIYTGTKATNTSFTVKGLKAGTAGYRFRIRAYKTYGNTKQYGSWSGEVKVNTNPYGVGGFKAKSTAKNSITLGWNKGTTASGYQLQQYKGGKWVTVYTGTKATSTSCTIKSLKANTSYKFRIRAYKTYGNTKQYGSWSSTLTVKTKK